LIIKIVKLNSEAKEMPLEKSNLSRKTQRGIFDTIFDHLSSIPYFKKTLKTLWLIIVLARIVTVSWAFFVGGPTFVIEGGFLKKLPSYLLGVVGFGLLFYYWERREKQRCSQET